MLWKETGETRGGEGGWLETGMVGRIMKERKEMGKERGQRAQLC